MIIVDGVIYRLEEISGFGPIPIRFDIQTSGSMPALGGSDTADIYHYGGAEGGSFIVPPGYPDDSFILGVTSGEHVEIVPNNTTNYNLTINEAGTRGNVIADFSLLKALSAV